MTKKKLLKKIQKLKCELDAEILFSEGNIRSLYARVEMLEQRTVANQNESYTSMSEVFWQDQ